MRNFSIAAVLAISSFASFAQAAPQSPSIEAPIAVDVQGKPLARTWLGINQFKPYAGVYAMADGRTLRIWNEHNRFFARFDKEAEVQIYAVGSGNFVAQHGDLTFTFDRDDGLIHDDVVVFTPSTGARVASR